MTNTTTTARRMPASSADLDEVRATVLVAGQVWSSRLVPAGALIRLTHKWERPRVVATLRAAGYTATPVSDTEDTVLVSGVLDPIAVLDAEIARLTERRDALAAEKSEILGGAR
ncbi:hypothetical protein [Marinactinospora rubrisoli]|uniref:Uncharacterized protein n=1 Tax=Marinactinospora rubrisoli TaxID=2715399 RepID=A0ABW2KN87_9ACTN